MTHHVHGSDNWGNGIRGGNNGNDSPGDLSYGNLVFGDSSHNGGYGGNDHHHEILDDVNAITCEALAPIFDGSAERCTEELARLEGLARVLEEKDPYSQAHSARVGTIAEAIADELGVDAEQMEVITQAATLHDLGKIGVPDEILCKPCKLTEEEFAIIRRHPRIAARLLRTLFFPVEWVRSVYHHHEWFNGGGYPEGSCGHEIPLGSRVIAVADAYDAMTSDRPYRKAVSAHQAERELMACSGSQFDPDVVRAFCNAKRKGKLRAAPGSTG